MKWLEKNDDQILMPVLREPRGYPPLCCNLIVPPKHPEAVAGFIVMEQVEYPVMSGGNTIAVATVLLETGMIPMPEPVTEFKLEAPAGPVNEDHCEDNARGGDRREPNAAAESLAERYPSSTLSAKVAIVHRG
jgi:proline racemase